MESYLEGLNKEQLEAVIHEAGPCMVLAGPGTGKTTIITSRVCNLIKKKISAGENILVVTFSRAAANEMKERYQKLSGRNREVCFGTFHSVFYRLLRQYKGYRLENLIDENQKFSMVRAIVRRLDRDFSEDEDKLRDIIRDMDYLTNTMEEVESYKPQSCDIELLKGVMIEYRNIKQSTDKYDYDDILCDCYYMLRDNPRILKEVQDRFRYILADEFQDINILQFETIKLIAGNNKNIFAVGDDDQSIYGFRGAAPDILLDFEKVYPNCKKIFLKRNYRTTKNILTSALSVIDSNKKRYKKELEAVNGWGTFPVTFETEDFEEEARIIASRILRMKDEGEKYSDIAVVYRTNLQSRAVIDAFMDFNVPFVTLDGIASIYNHWIFKDIMAYMKLSIGINTNKDFIRIMNKPKRYISRDAMEMADRIEGSFLDNLITYCGLNRLQVNAVNELSKDVSRLSDMRPHNAVKYIRNVIGYDEYIMEYAAGKRINSKGLFETIEEIESSAKGSDSITGFLQHIDQVSEQIGKKDHSNLCEDQVKLMTMHRAKGLEFGTVFICGSVEGLSPYIRNDSSEDKDIEEERRLFYVAMTRAKKQLYISIPKRRYGKSVRISRFVEELRKGIDYGSQVYIGQKVFHKIYFSGIVSEIIGKGDEERIRVDFGGNIRELNLKTCIKNEIIRFL